MPDDIKVLDSRGTEQTVPTLQPVIDALEGNLLEVGISGTPATDVMTVQGIEGATPVRVITEAIESPFTTEQIDENTAATFVLVAVSGTTRVKVYKLFISSHGMQTIDFQDTNGDSLMGGPIPIAEKGGIALDYDGIPWMETPNGEGFQIVTTEAVRICGIIQYVQD